MRRRSFIALAASLFAMNAIAQGIGAMGPGPGITVGSGGGVPDVAVRSSSISGATTSNSVSVTAPAGTAAGDVVIVVVSWNNLVTISDNNGATPFTKDLQYQEPTSGATIGVFSRRIQGGDPSSFSFTCGTSGRATAIAVAFSNPDATNIYNVSPSSGNSNTYSTTQVPDAITVDITTTVNNSIHVVFGEADNALAVWTGTPSGYTSQQNGGTQPSVLATKTIAVAGATGAQTFTRDGYFAITTSFAIKNNK